MLDQIQIDHQLFNELGIDSEDLVKSFARMKNKERSLAVRLDKDTLAFLKKKYPEKIDSNELYIRSLLGKNYNLCVLLHIITRKIDLFDDEISKNLYEKTFQKKLSNKQRLLLEAYINGRNEDLIRKIHYSKLLNYGRYITCKITDKVDGISIKELTIEEVEKILRSLFKSPKKKKSINVWYVLNTDEEMAFFIFRKAKSRKSIPSSWKRGYNFIEYAKPLMFAISHSCEKLYVYTGEINQSIKFASSLVINSNPSLELKSPIYEQTYIYTQKTKIDDFLLRIKNNQDENIELTEIKFQPKEESYDTFLKATKLRDDLKMILGKIEKDFQTEINTNIISEITVKYNNKLFYIYIIAESENKVLVCYTPRTKNFTISKSFVNYLDNSYQIKLNKKSR